MKSVFITGASGFVGRFLSQQFLEKGYRVTGTGTSERHELSRTHEAFEWLRADTSQPGTWQDRVSQSDIVVNLAGRNIFSYWTRTYKQSIYDSRIFTTRHVVQAMANGSLLLNASAVGFYGDKKESDLTEDMPPGDDFLARVCLDWEKEAYQALEKGSRVAVMRFGVVLGNGGALAKMLPAFKMMAGGPLGSGRQWFPWIHIRDLFNAVLFIAGDDSLSGAFNFTAPSPVRQKAFAKKLGAVLNRPAVIPAPAFAVRLVMGEMGKSFLNSQKAFPEKLLDHGFRFSFPGLDGALENILKPMEGTD